MLESGFLVLEVVLGSFEWVSILKVKFCERYNFGNLFFVFFFIYEMYIIFLFINMVFFIFLDFVDLKLFFDIKFEGGR